MPNRIFCLFSQHLSKEQQEKGTTNLLASVLGVQSFRTLTSLSTVGALTCNKHAMIGIKYHRVNLHVSWSSLAIMEDL